jgi:hypothetical protein
MPTADKLICNLTQATSSSSETRHITVKLNAKSMEISTSNLHKA